MMFTCKDKILNTSEDDLKTRDSWTSHYTPDVEISKPKMKVTPRDRIDTHQRLAPQTYRTIG